MARSLTPHRLVRLCVAGGVALTLTLTGCGGSSSEKSGEGGVKKVTMAGAPLASISAIELGKQKGFYTAEGIDLTLNTTLPSPQITSNVVSGKMQFGANSWGSIASLRSTGVPVSVVSNVSTGGTSLSDDDFQLVVPESSPITSTQGLAGKTVAVGALKSTSELQLRVAASNAGVTDLQVVQIPFPDMPAALRAGRVDAITMPEPFLTLTNADTKLRALAAVQAEVMPDMPVVEVFTTDKLVKQDPALVDAMRRATDKSVDYAAAHPDEVKPVVASVLKVPAAVADTMIPPRFSSKIDLAKVQKIADLSLEYKIITKPVDMSKSVTAP